PAGSIKTNFHYNRAFSYPPDAKTDAAWGSIFPRGFGFIQHPVLAPNQSGIAVFHQLHCLNGLRKQYYLSLERGSGTGGEFEAKNGETKDRNRSDPAHVRHCFDLLRQSLMCSADTNIEPVDSELGGITGWGSERKCRDFGTVFEWAGKWAYQDPLPETV
ncbi:uncharacterized protein BDR25DRAFT_237348, partial [Lindgomyces ingoldianus]